MTKQWEIVTEKEDIQYSLDPDSHVFAICINGIVQITIVVDETLASLYDLGPSLVRCKPTAVPGMTVEEARV